MHEEDGTILLLTDFYNTYTACSWALYMDHSQRYTSRNERGGTDTFDIYAYREHPLLHYAGTSPRI